MSTQPTLLFRYGTLYLYCVGVLGAGQVVKAFVVLSADYVNQDRPQLIEQLQEHVRNTTAPYKYPRKVSELHCLINLA